MFISLTSLYIWVNHLKVNFKIKLFLAYFITLWSKQVYAENVIFAADNYKCLTDYVWEGDVKNRDVPSQFTKPSISLTDSPKWAVLHMPNYGMNGDEKLFKFIKKINDKTFGYGFHYRSDLNGGYNFLDIYSNGKVVFGVANEVSLAPTIKMYCSDIRRLKGYWEWSSN